MAKQVSDALGKPSMFVKVREFYDEVKTEMSKVTWPSLDELKASTSVVLMMLGIVAVIIYVYDLVFQFIVLRLLAFG